MKKLFPILPFLALLLTACSPGRHDRMKQELAALQAMNQADSVLTNDSLAQALADYFDRHGTPNEQMEAHYLLGRTHADRGEAPAALAAYHDAIDRADTTAADCNYHQLCRVYGQMADIFYEQNLSHHQLHCLTKSTYYARMAGDSIMIASLTAHMMTVYDRLGMNDSVIYAFKKAYSLFTSLGYPDIAAQYCGFAVKPYLNNHDYSKAKEYMETYESMSGFFDEQGNIESSREAYYDLKAKYYASTGRKDSAYYYYRKELNDGSDFNNQNMAAKGLAQLFLQDGMFDSATVYALYSYDMNDSLYDRMTTRDVANTQGLYDYTRHQKIAQEEKERNEHLRNMIILLLSSMSLIIYFAMQAWWYFRKKRKKEILAWKKLQDDLIRAQSDVLSLRSQRKVLERIILQNNVTSKAIAADSEEIKMQHDSLVRQLAEKEELVERLHVDLQYYIKKEHMAKKSVEEKIMEFAIFQTLTSKSHRGEKLSEEEWNDLRRMVLEVMPGFNHFLINKRHSLNDIQFETCLLLRLHVPQSSISEMLGVSAPYIQKMCKKSLKTLFGEEGTGTDLYKRLAEIC